jgi:predicted CoA-substrate-specific enzyme activase
VRTAGVDLGSRAVKVVLLEDGRLPELRLAPGGWDPLQTCDELLRGQRWDAMVVTGYGRHLGSRHYGCPALTEIKAVALAAAALHPEARGVVDVGGQDTKALRLDERGRLQKFVMNDRCAAGTGRFLEVMATAMGLRLDEFVAAALAAPQAESLSSMCAVFAESEVVSHISRGASRDSLALGIHRSVAQRTAALARSLGLGGDGPVLFTGGGALNACLARELGREVEVRVPGHAQFLAAWGCALQAGTISMQNTLAIP